MLSRGTTNTFVPKTRSNPTAHLRSSANLHNVDSADLRFSIEVKFCGLDDHNGMDHPLPEWLYELREMRGRVCYEEGHRLSFRLPDGSFCDLDSADLGAYHIVTRWEGRAVGCARVLPLTDGQPSTLESTVGRDRFEEILSRIGTTRARSCEASRWLVVPEYRRGLGPQIVAASWAIAQWLPVETAFVLAGTRQKQDCALIRMGAKPIPDLQVFPSEIFDDDLRVLYFDVSYPSEWMAKQIVRMRSVLKLDARWAARKSYYSCHRVSRRCSTNDAAKR